MHPTQQLLRRGRPCCGRPGAALRAPRPCRRPWGRAVQGNQWLNTRDQEFEGLAAEEDWQVPGGYQTSLSSSTELGRAVQEAVQELDTLAALERDNLSQAQALLQKLGYKGDIGPGGAREEQK